MVIYTYTFKSQYRNDETGEIVQVHTNRIEGAWKHAKDHFKRMSGTFLSQFEGHIAEVMWRSEVKGRVFEPFFDTLRSVYTLQGPPNYTYPTPLFDTWNSDSIETWEIVPLATDAESTDSEVSSGADVLSVSSDSERREEVAEIVTPSSRLSERSRKLVSELFSSTDSEDESEKTMVAPPDTASADVVALPSTRKKSLKLKLKKTSSVAPSAASNVDPSVKTSSKKPAGTRNQTDRVCHPPGFSLLDKAKSRRARKPAKNPYSKDAFTWSSEDSDFA